MHAQGRFDQLRPSRCASIAMRSKAETTGRSRSEAGVDWRAEGLVRPRVRMIRTAEPAFARAGLIEPGFPETTRVHRAPPPNLRQTVRIVATGVWRPEPNHWRAITRLGVGAPVTHRAPPESRLAVKSAASINNEPRRRISMAFDLLVCHALWRGDLGTYFNLILNA